MIRGVMKVRFIATLPIGCLSVVGQKCHQQSDSAGPMPAWVLDFVALHLDMQPSGAIRAASTSTASQGINGVLSMWQRAADSRSVQPRQLAVGHGRRDDRDIARIRSQCSDSSKRDAVVGSVRVALHDDGALQAEPGLHAPVRSVAAGKMCPAPSGVGPWSGS